MRGAVAEDANALRQGGCRGGAGDAAVGGGQAIGEGGAVQGQVEGGLVRGAGCLALEDFERVAGVGAVKVVESLRGATGHGRSRLDSNVSCSQGVRAAMVPSP